MDELDREKYREKSKKVERNKNIQLTELGK
jgi:hypothetical protein